MPSIRHENLENERVLVTGANGGLGLASCIGALREGATVVMACRTDEKAARAREEALAAARVDEERVVAAGGFDMLDPSSIETAVARLPTDPVDVVFLQAGGWVWADEVQSVSINGVTIERTVAQNVVGAHATLRALMASGRLAAGARVVLVGGEGARGVPGGIRKPEFLDLADFERYLAADWAGRSAYVPVDALGASKFCAALWVQALARRIDVSSLDLEVVWFTPGLVAGTAGTRGMPAWQEFLMQRVAFPVAVAFGKAQWPREAAAKCVDCLAGRVGGHGDLLGAPEGSALGPIVDQKPLHRRFADVAFQDAVWRACEAAAGTIPLVDRVSELA